MQLCTLSMPLVRSLIVTCLATLSGNGGHGVAFEKLKSDEVRELEPGLSRDYQRGIFFPGGGHVTSPLALVEGLMGRAAALGVANRTARVLAIEPGIDEVTLQTNTGPHRCEIVVIAAGIDSRDLARSLGILCRWPASVAITSLCRAFPASSVAP